jgi:hypothetical protein
LIKINHPKYFGYTKTKIMKLTKGSPFQLKDACYKKVAGRYPGGNSAYRSGAMVKCRKVGAANWGNSSKK